MHHAVHWTAWFHGFINAASRKLETCVVFSFIFNSPFHCKNKTTRIVLHGADLMSKLDKTNSMCAQHPQKKNRFALYKCLIFLFLLEKTNVSFSGAILFPLNPQGGGLLVTATSSAVITFFSSSRHCSLVSGICKEKLYHLVHKREGSVGLQET